MLFIVSVLDSSYEAKGSIGEYWHFCWMGHLCTVSAESAVIKAAALLGRRGETGLLALLNSYDAAGTTGDEAAAAAAAAAVLQLNMPTDQYM